MLPSSGFDIMNSTEKQFKKSKDASKAGQVDSLVWKKLKTQGFMLPEAIYL